LEATQFSYHDATAKTDLIYHNAHNPYQIAKAYRAEYGKLA
jgi:hypothetical protein